MNPQPIPAAIIETRSRYARRNWVLSPDGTAPTVLANWGIKSPPPLVLAEEATQ